MDNSSKNAGEMIDKLTLLQQIQTGCHYRRAHRNYFWCCCSVNKTPNTISPNILKKRTWRTNGLDQALHRFTEKIKKYFFEYICRAIFTCEVFSQFEQHQKRILNSACVWILFSPSITVNCFTNCCYVKTFYVKFCVKFSH